MNTIVSRRANIACVLIFIFCASVFMIFSSGRYGGDGLENYLTAESMVLDGDTAIHDRPFGVDEMKYTIRGNKDASGRYYSDYGIGMPVLLVPFYALGHMISRFVPGIPHDYLTQFCVSMINPLIIALTALVLFIILGKLDFKPATCFLTILFYSFCTMSFVYSRSGFSEPAIGLFLLLALFFILKYEEKGFARYVFLASLFVGYTLLVKKNSFLYLPLGLVYLVYRSWSERALRPIIKLWAAAMVPVAFFILVYLYTSAPGGAALKEMAERGITSGHFMIKGLFYYLLSPGKGYFLYNLPLLLALFAVGDLIGKRKKVTVYIIVFLAVNLLFYAFKFRRGSLFSWGPRYLYPTIPFMCVFLAAFIEKARSAAKKILLVIFASAGFLVQLPCLFVSFSNYLFFVKEKLGLREYLINFMPELSPVRGSWMLFVSAVSRLAGGVSLSFSYGPDYRFIKPIVGSFEGYDVWDIWWVSAIKVEPGIYFAVAGACVLLGAIAVISFLKLKNIISERA